MYNESRKRAYLEFYSSNEITLRSSQSIFDTLEKYEEACEKDLCELSEEVLQKAVNESFGVRSDSISKVISFIRNYNNWCLSQGIDVNDGAFNIQVDTNEKIRQTMFASPLHLSLVLDEIFDDIEKESIDCLYRVYLWMAFAGLNESDTVKVKAGDIDFGNMTIGYNDREYDIYRESLPVFKNVFYLTEFTYIHNNPDYEVKRQRVESEFLLRGFKVSQMRTSTINPAIRDRATAKNIKLTYKKVHMSGMFYRVYELERAGVKPDFSGIIADRVDNSGRTYSEKRTRKDITRVIKKGLDDDYDRWKAAFG